jgi:hypothetical protein
MQIPIPLRSAPRLTPRLTLVSVAPHPVYSALVTAALLLMLWASG